MGLVYSVMDGFYDYDATSITSSREMHMRCTVGHATKAGGPKDTRRLLSWKPCACLCTCHGVFLN